MKSWKILSIAGLVLASVAIWSGTVQAQYRGPDIDQRQAIQTQRIQEGVRSGALTPQEAGRLQAQQQRLQVTKAQMGSDSRLDPREQHRLNKMVNKSDRAVFRETHDRQVAHPGYGNHHEPRFHHQKAPNAQHHVAAREQHGHGGAPQGPHPGDRGKVPPPHRDQRHALGSLNGTILWSNNNGGPNLAPRCFIGLIFIEQK